MDFNFFMINDSIDNNIHALNLRKKLYIANHFIKNISFQWSLPIKKK